MDRDEDLLVLHAERGQVGDVEEAAIVDLFRRDAPIRKSVELMFKKVVEQVEAVRISRLAVDENEVPLHELAKVRFAGDESGEPPPDRSLRSGSLDPLIGRDLRMLGKTV